MNQQANNPTKQTNKHKPPLRYNTVEQYLKSLVALEEWKRIVNWCFNEAVTRNVSVTIFTRCTTLIFGFPI